MQELQSNNESVTDNMLILILQTFDEDKICLGNDDENNKTDEILYKEQNRRMAVQMISRFFLHHKNLKKTKDAIWRMTMRAIKSIKVWVYHHLYKYVFIVGVLPL